MEGFLERGGWDVKGAGCLVRQVGPHEIGEKSRAVAGKNKEREQKADK